jgi:hypothetical protein
MKDHLPDNPLRSELQVAVSKLSTRPPFLWNIELSNGLLFFFVETEQGGAAQRKEISEWFFQFSIEAIKECHSLPLFRAVSLDAKERVLMNGIDVLPTDAVIWANDLEKALEYGGSNQLVMILYRKSMRPSFMLVDRNSTPEVIKSIEEEYGTNPVAFDDGTLFYSRLPSTDRRRASPYEVENGWYIPGDPFSVLAGIIFVSINRP